MTPTLYRIAVLGTILASAAGAGRAATDDGRWQLRLTGIYAEPTGDIDPLGGAPGFGLGLEYRASRRIGVELGALTAEFEHEEVSEFLPGAAITAELSLRATPVLARLNVHLTPDRRADLYAGPVVGYVRYGDFKVAVRGDIPGVPISGEMRAETEDDFAWGAHAGVDVRLGGGRSFLSAGATFLKASVTARGEETGEADVDPLVFHLGYAVRF